MKKNCIKTERLIHPCVDELTRGRELCAIGGEKGADGREEDKGCQEKDSGGNMK